MGKLQSLIDKKAEAAKFMAQEIKYICTTMGKRGPGSLGELKACNYMADYMKNECGAERADVEAFTENPHAFMGWIWYTVALAFVGMILFYFIPIAAAIVTVLGFVIMFFQFGLYKRLLDNFFKAEIGHNVTAIKKCSGEVKGRVFFNGHPDAVWNWPVNNKFGGTVYLSHIVISILGVILSLVFSICATVTLAKQGIWVNTVTDFAAMKGIFGWTLTAELVDLVFLPFLVLLFIFMWDPNHFTDGANDNLTGCYMGIAILKYMKENGIDLKHTEVGVIISGSEEAGLRGAKAWCIAHQGEFDDVPTWIYSYDTIHESRFLGVNYRDLNGTVKSDKEVSDSFMDCAKELGIKCSKTWVPPLGGATDNAAFSQAGYRSTGITALDHNLKDYYHTMRDSWDNLNEECLADCYAISVKCLEKFDSQFKD